MTQWIDRNVPFGVISLAPSGEAPPMMVASVIARDCGCKVIFGTILDESRVALIQKNLALHGSFEEMPEDVRMELAVETYGSCGVPCPAHEVEMSSFISAFKASIEQNPQERDSVEVAAEMLDLEYRAFS